MRGIPLLVAGFLTACETGGPAGPTMSDGLIEIIDSLRGNGLTVSLAGDTPRQPFFSVPAQGFLLGGERLTIFEYPTSAAAVRDAVAVTADGQPSPTTMVEWVSTPRFYRKDRVIALYVGCAAPTVRALDATMGPAFVIGSVPCR